MKRLILLISTLLSLGVHAYVSKSATEATLSFEYFIDLPRHTLWDDARAEIDNQLKYQYGTMQITDYRGAPKGEYTLKFLKAENIDEPSGKYRIHYAYEGLIELQKGPKTKYEFYLPKNPDKNFIYKAGMDKEGTKNLCTDRHYNTFDDYWYFFNPILKQCPLREKEGVDYNLVKGSVVRIENTKISYPEYDRLIDPKTGKISIFVLIGMDDPEHDRAPMGSTDINAKSYRSIRRRLIDDGFSARPFTSQEMNTILEGHEFRKPYVEVLSKDTERAPIEITLFFGPTTEWTHPSASAFHYFLKYANQYASVMIYDGHSDVGKGLDFKRIEEKHKFKFTNDPKRYQIFFFNSCTSYAYYNSVFFYRKSPHRKENRTKFLDIMTNGLATAFDPEQEINLTLIFGAEAWANKRRPPSYQKMASKMEDDDLFAINGDEDNPTEPPG